MSLFLFNTANGTQEAAHSSPTSTPEKTANKATPDIVTSDSLQKPQFVPSSNRVIGKVSWVSKDTKTAVIRLHYVMNIESSFLLARDSNLINTAVFQLSPIQKGRSLGLLILEGQPIVNQEVILPNHNIQETIRKTIEYNKNTENRQKQ